jgi:hypothetical protein
MEEHVHSPVAFFPPSSGTYQIGGCVNPWASLVVVANRVSALARK